MAKLPWSEGELAALDEVADSNGMAAYHAWGALTNYSKSYNAFEVKRRRVTQLFDAADRLAALPPLTETEVEAEIQAARAERRVARASGR